MFFEVSKNKILQKLPTSYTVINLIKIIRAIDLSSFPIVPSTTRIPTTIPH